MNLKLSKDYCFLYCWWMAIATIGKTFLDCKPWPYLGAFVSDMEYDSNELLQSFCIFIDKVLTIYPCEIEVE